MGVFFSKPSLLVDASWFSSSDRKTYDFVVAGGGAAGCTLANRLSEDGKTKVLLIEAGGDHENELFSKIPACWPRMLRSACDWGYSTTPQSTLNSRQLYWPRGKMLGGSSSINALMYHHCAPSDFDEWASMGATGWSYADMQGSFRRAEKFTPHILHPDVDISHRGQDGFWQTSFSYCSPISQAFVKAAQALGITHNPDVNTLKGTLGVAALPTYIDQAGSRSSSATAYLPRAVLGRPNLTVAVSTRVTKVLLSDDNTRAIGLEVVDEKGDGNPLYISAVHEVILCAGAINTPQVLMLSGIGPSKALEAVGIPVKHDLPCVGQNLQDHMLCGIYFRAKQGRTLDYLRSPILRLPALIRWTLGFKGPMTSNVAEVAAFVRTDDPRLRLRDPFADVKEDLTSGPDAPDLELICAPAMFKDHGFKPAPSGSSVFCVAVVPLRPASVGNVSLASAHPFDKPIIEPNYLSARSDMDILVRGIRLALRIGRSSPLVDNLELKEDADPSKYSNEDEEVFNMGDANEKSLTDEQIEDWIRRYAETIYHPVGTCRIGQSGTDSVVDPSLIVHGIEGLRVVDASVFPRIVSGHPCAPVIAVAEKASDMIRATLK